VFFSYDHLLARGRVVHEYAQSVSPTQVRVSATAALDADFLVLATGTAYPFPAKFIESESRVATARLARLRRALGRAERALLVGAGPVGLELAGELASAFPGLGLTIVDQAEDVLTTGDYLPELRSAVRSQLEIRGVVFELGSPLGYLPPCDVGVLAPFSVHTTAGQRIDVHLHRGLRAHRASAWPGRRCVAGRRARRDPPRPGSAGDEPAEGRRPVQHRHGRAVRYRSRHRGLTEAPGAGALGHYQRRARSLRSHPGRAARAPKRSLRLRYTT
jgi:hypothetical protein